jgi:hypothetical protein
VVWVEASAGARSRFCIIVWNPWMNMVVMSDWWRRRPKRRSRNFAPNHGVYLSIAEIPSAKRPETGVRATWDQHLRLARQLTRSRHPRSRHGDLRASARCNLQQYRQSGLI